MKIAVNLIILCMIFVPCNAMYLSKIVHAQKTKSSYKTPFTYNNIKSTVSSAGFKTKFLQQLLHKNVVLLPSAMIQQQIMVMSNKKESFVDDLADLGCIGQLGLGMIVMGGIFYAIFGPALLNVAICETVGWRGPTAATVSVIGGIGETSLLFYGAYKIWNAPCDATHLSKAACSSRVQKNHFISPLHRNTAIKLLSSKIDLKK